jgi:Flp pilus assembly protein TadG
MKQGTHVRAGNNMDIDPVDGAPAPGSTAPVPSRRRAGASRSAARGRRGRRDRGASIVEFAIIMPLLFALVLGIIDFGNVYNDVIAQRQGAREGARQAVTGNVGSTTSCEIAAGTNTGTTVNQELICLVKERTGLGNSRVRVALRFEHVAGNTATAETYATTRSLKICTMVRVNSLTGFYGAILNNRIVQTEVQMKKEQMTTALTPTPKGALTEFHEAPLSGDWSFCDRTRT